MSGWILIPTGNIDLGPGAKSELPELVTISVPVGAPLCTIPLSLTIQDGTETYVQTKVELTIVPK